MSERSLEIRVGLVILAAIGVLALFVLWLGDIDFERGTQIRVDYAFSGAIQPGAPVKISGVKVGRVKDLELIGGRIEEGGEPIQVRLVLFVEDRAKPVLREGARFYVNTQGLLGEMYVEIVPARRPGPPLPPDAIVRGVDPPRFDLLVQRVYDFLELISRMLDGNEQVLADLVRAATDLAHTTDAALKENRTEIARAIHAAADAAVEARDLMASVRRSIGPDGARLDRTLADVEASTALVRKDLPETMGKLRSSLGELERLLHAFDGVDRRQVDALLHEAGAASKHADEVLADAASLAKRIRAGQGTVGLLVTDDAIYDDLKELLRDLKQHPWKLVWKK